MIQKEVSELRRRFRPDKNAISRVYGCYVNTNREIISYLNEPVGLMTQEESEQYLGLLKKAISGTLGKNLVDIVFSTQQVADSEEHRLLMALRQSALKDTAAREAFFQRVIQSLDMGDCNYLILLAHDAYDVPYRGKDDDLQPDASDQVFSYLVCAICPVKDGKPALGFFAGENEFHSCMAKQIVGQPELGFLFPAFDNRSANLYNALYYLRKPEVSHPEFVEAVFRTELPMTSVEQREAFCGALQEALEEDCSVNVVQAVHERLRELVEGHKEAKIAEPLEVSAREIGQFLRDAGISDQRVQEFCQQCDERFGKQAPLHPENLVDCRRFQLKTESASVTVDPAQSYQVEGRILEGRKYLLIPADDGAELNGVPVDIRKQ